MAIVETECPRSNCETVAFVVVRWRELMLFASCVAILTLQWRELLSLIGRIALAVPEMRRRVTIKSLEIAAKVTSVTHAHAGGNLLHTQERFIKQGFSLLHAKAPHILLGRERSFSLEQPDKVTGRKPHLLREFADWDVSMNVCMNDFDCSLDSPVHILLHCGQPRTAGNPF